MEEVQIRKFKKNKDRIHYVQQKIQVPPQDIQIIKTTKYYNQNNQQFIIKINDSDEDLEQNFRQRQGVQKSKMSMLIRDRSLKNYGTFNKDFPLFISKHRMDAKLYYQLKNDKNYDQKKLKINNYLYKVEWDKRPSGLKPLPSYYTYQELKKHTPRLLLSYLENMAQLLR